MLNQFHSWNKSHMVMVYNSFYVLMVLFGNILLCPCSLEILVYSFFFFLVMSSSDFGVWLLLAS